MMIVKQFLQELKDRDIDISINDNNIDIHYDGDLDPTVLETIVNNKQELISFLKSVDAGTGAFNHIPRSAPQKNYPLSSPQKRLWVLSQFDEANLAYNVSGCYTLKGDLDISSLERSFFSLIKRHEILRTLFRIDDAGEPGQIVLSPDSTGFRLVCDDLRATNNKDEVVENIVRQEICTPFDLTTGPLFRARVSRLKNEEYVLVYVMHHIISDGWSMNLFIGELLQLYAAYSRGADNPLSNLRIQYKDYSVWQQDALRRDIMTTHRAYWMGQLEGTLPVLELPGNRPRPPMKTYNGDIVKATFGKNITTALKQLYQENGCTLFMGLMATVNALLYRYTEQTDIIIGSGIAGRDHADLEDQIGYYLNTLPLRIRFKDSDCFIDLLSNTKAVTLGAYEHQVYPFDELINDLSLKMDMSRSALFDVSVVLQNISNTAARKQLEKKTGIEIGTFDAFEYRNSKFDLSFTFEEQGEELDVMLTYNSDIYDKAFSLRLLGHLKNLVACITKAPYLAIAELEILDEQETRQLLYEFNQTTTVLPNATTVIELFERQTAAAPTNIAIVSGDRKLTYKELNEQSNRLAAYLKTKYETGTGDIIGIRLNERLPHVMAILAVLKAGSAYVPIDNSYPAERIDYIIGNSNCKVVIDEEEFARFNTERYKYDGLDLKLSVGNMDLAYVIYTSGSSGHPKGVMVEHGSLLNFCLWHKSEFSITEKDRSTLCLGVGFDAAVMELFPYLISGSALYVLGKNTLLDIDGLNDYFNEQGITISGLSTAIFEQFLAVDNRSLRCLITGGDKLKTLRGKNYRLANQYGPTECTVTATNIIFDHPGPYDSIPIGKPINNTRAYILNQNSRLVPIGLIGELCIGGSGLARGYLNNEALTAEKFVRDIFYPGQRIYRTGDLCKWLPDGNIEFVGRKDRQVKIRGYRVELGEIEQALCALENISTAIVMNKPGDHGENTLIAYVGGDQLADIGGVKDKLRAALPDFMIPDHFIRLSDIPLTPNGKIDMSALPDVNELTGSDDTYYQAPRNEIEEQLVNIWKEILGKQHIGVKDDFFSLGGHSLKATKLSSRIHKAFDVKISLSELFSTSKLEQQASLIDLLKLRQDTNGNNVNTREQFEIHTF